MSHGETKTDWTVKNFDLLVKINHLLDEKKGGVSSFTVGKYAVAYLDKAKHPETANLGDIFLGFLEYYGEQSGLGIDRICQDGYAPYESRIGSNHFH